MAFHATLLAALEAVPVLPALTALQALPAPEDRLTFAEVLDDVPLDPASLFVYVLLAVGVAWVVWSGRSRGGRPPRAPA